MDDLRQALSLHQSGQLDEAQTLYEQILAREPRNPNALNLLGMVHHQKSDHRRAEQLIRDAIGAVPTIPGFHNNLANVLLAQRDLEGAQAAYEKAIQLDPNYAEAHNNLGVALLGQGKVEDAMRQLVHTINLKPDYPSARNNLGNALRAKYMYREAINCYRDALQLKSDYPEAHANLAIALLAMNEAEEAIAEAEKSLALRPNDTGPIMTRGFALEKLGRTGEAIASYQNALALRPSTSLRFQLSALTGKEKFAAAPPQFIASLFDNYAQTFDRHLVEVLQYRGHEQVVEALKAAGVKQGDTVVDLGCGTGLCGTLLRPMSKKLLGVDLSPRMIGQARERKVYDELFVDEIVAFLQTRFAQFNIATAADVLTYIGDLQPTLSYVAQSLQPAGHFAFTVEANEGEGCALNTTRRYTHSIDYIRSLLKPTHFREISASKSTLRHEHGQEVAAWVVVLQRA